MDPNAELDNLMQGRLYEHSVAPPAFVWTNIENELRRRRRKFIALWWFVGIGLTATGLWALSVYPSGNAPATPAPIHRPVEKPEQDAAATPAVEPPATAAVVPAAEVPEAANSETAPTNSIAVFGKTRQGNNRNAGAEPAPAVTENTPNAEDAVIVAIESTNGVAMRGEDKPTTETQTFATFAALPPADAGMDARKRPSPEYPKVKPIVRRKQESKNCYDFDHMGTVWWLDAYAGPSLTRRQFNAKDSEYDNYLQQRLETETPDMAFNAGVRAGMFFRENFVVRSGLHYDQFVEKFEWVDPNSIEVNIRTHTQLVNGVWETVIDTLSIEYGDNYIKTYNRFGMLDIPLEMGIELRRGRTGVSINGGVSLNLLFWKRGAILSPDNNQPAYFTPEDGTIEVFKTNAGLSIGGSVQWFYHIKPTIRLFAEPYYRQVLKPITVDDHHVEQQYGIGGLKIGMTKILHGK